MKASYASRSPLSLMLFGAAAAIASQACIASPGSDEDMGTTSDALATSCVSSDVDRDGDVDAVDVQLVTNASLGLRITGNADVNGDGKVNAVDVQQVTNCSLQASQPAPSACVYPGTFDARPHLSLPGTTTPAIYLVTPLANRAVTLRIDYNSHAVSGSAFPSGDYVAVFDGPSCKGRLGPAGTTNSPVNDRVDAVDATAAHPVRSGCSAENLASVTAGGDSTHNSFGNLHFTVDTSTTVFAGSMQFFDPRINAMTPCMTFQCSTRLPTAVDARLTCTWL